MPRPISSKGATKKADTIFSLLIRSLGYCENCGKTKADVQLHCAHWIGRRFRNTHWIGRRFRNTRWDPDNAFCLCAGCHMWFTDHPTEFGRWAIERRGEETYLRLREAANQTSKVNAAEQADILAEILEEANAAS